METIQQILADEKYRHAGRALSDRLESAALEMEINYDLDARNGYPELIRRARGEGQSALLDIVVKMMLGCFTTTPERFFARVKRALRRQVATENSPYARYFLAARLPQGEERRRELLRAAEDGCPYAYYQLACEAQGTEQADSVLGWLRKGAENGCPIAQYEYALLLEKTDLKQALAYMEKAHEAERVATLELLRWVIADKVQTDLLEDVLIVVMKLTLAGDEEAIALFKQAEQKGLCLSSENEEDEDASEIPDLTESDEEKLAALPTKDLVIMLVEETEAYFKEEIGKMTAEYAQQGRSCDMSSLLKSLLELPEDKLDARSVSIMGFCQFVGIGCRKNRKLGLENLMKAVRRYDHVPSALLVALLAHPVDRSVCATDEMAAECLFMAAMLGHPIAKVLMSKQQK